jgi:hypothetical protein
MIECTSDKTTGYFTDRTKQIVSFTSMILHLIWFVDDLSVFCSATALKLDDLSPGVGPILKTFDTNFQHILKECVD